MGPSKSAGRIPELLQSRIAALFFARQKAASSWRKYRRPRQLRKRAHAGRPPPQLVAIRGRGPSVLRVAIETPSSKTMLKEIRVLDLTRVLAGPLCTMMLGDLGANVIKVERPDSGDDTRHWGPPFVEEGATYYLALNRNKRSLVLDLKDPADLALARELCDRADVVVESFRP